MREILFRGKNCWGKWVEGFYYQAKLRRTDNNLCDYITIPHIERGVPNDHHIVDSNTIGQYTGLTDKNGTKIFEGDIVKNDWCFLRGYSVVKFGQYKSLDMIDEYQQGHLGFYLEHIHEIDKQMARKDIMYFANKCEVIGNIHDNPELMGGD